VVLSSRAPTTITRRLPIHSWANSGPVSVHAVAACSFVVSVALVVPTVPVRISAVHRRNLGGYGFTHRWWGRVHLGLEHHVTLKGGGDVSFIA
jgi:hypothetical protein